MAGAAYPRDLTDPEWILLDPLIPPAKPGGHPRTVDMREVVNGIFYVLRRGGAWRMLPHEFPPWSTVDGYFNQWRTDGIWEQMNDVLREAVRVEAGREADPSAAIMDSQSGKPTETRGERGDASSKNVKGRKRHLLVDVMGLVLVVLVHKASLQDRTGAKSLLSRAKRKGFQRLALIWADGGSSGQPMIDWVGSLAGWILQIIERAQDATGGVVLPRRWVVERTVAWVGRYRRLSKDYEHLPETREAMIYAAMVHLMLKRLARTPASAL